MNINFDIELKNWQKDALQLVNTYQHDICVIKSPRQRGKSFFIEFYVIKYALEHNGSRTYYLSVSFKQCLKVMEELKTVLKDAPFVVKIDNASLIIKFINGSFIYFISAEQDEDKLQGNSCELLIIDECAYIVDDIIFTVLPYTNVSRGQVICVSTPRFKQGAFYDLYSDGLNENIPDVHSLDVCEYDTSDMISETRLAYYRKTLPSMKYKMFYMGEFVDGEGEVFQDFGKCIGVPNEEDYKDDVYIGVDWGAATGNDSTVMTAITKNNVVLGVKGFNDIGSTDAIDEIVKFAEQFNVKKIVVEKNSIGNVYFDILKKKARQIGKLWNIEAFTTTNDTKLNQVEYLQVLFQNKQIVIPNNENLINQLSAYARTLSKTGKQVFNAAKNGHDDYVISLMLASWAAKTNKPKVSF